MICKKCGENVPDGMSNCTVCGAEMVSSPFMRAANLDDSDLAPVMKTKQDAVKTVAPQEIRINMGDPRKITAEETSTAKPQYCVNCGAVMEQDSRFCTNCGSSTDDAYLATEEEINVNDAGKSTNKKPLIIGGAVAILVLVIGIALFALLSGRSAEKTVEKFIDAQFSADAEAIIELIPDEIVEYILDEEGYDEYDEFLEEGEDSLKDMLESVEDVYGEDWSYSFEITEMEEASNKKLRELKEEYEDEFDVEIDGAQTVKVKITVKGEDLEQTNSMKIKLVKIGNTWYVDAPSMGGLF